MTKQEIQKAIENGESVWGCLLECLLEICNDNTVKIDETIVGSTEINEYGFNFIDDLFNNSFYLSFKDVYRTKVEAEHYLRHANISRTEQLPFLTWEEFLEETRLNFIACDGISNMTLYYCDNTIYLVDDEYPEFNTTSWELTEENFYKAYDECVRLFKG